MRYAVMVAVGRTRDEPIPLNGSKHICLNHERTAVPSAVALHQKPAPTLLSYRGYSHLKRCLLHFI